MWEPLQSVHIGPVVLEIYHWFPPLSVAPAMMPQQICDAALVTVCNDSNCDYMINFNILYSVVKKKVVVPSRTGQKTQPPRSGTLVPGRPPGRKGAVGPRARGKKV